MAYAVGITTLGNPLPVITPIPAAPITGQAKVVATNTAVALGGNTLLNGVVVKAKTTNTGTVFVGPSSVTTTDNGAGNGYALLPGEAISLAVANTSSIYINGTAGDSVYFAGN